LVVNRKNIEGAKSQVIEKMPDGENDRYFEHKNQSGNFLFQSDIGEEKRGRLARYYWFRYYNCSTQKLAESKLVPYL